MSEVRLGGYPASKCARVTHNNFAPGTPELGPVPPDLQALLDAGRAFEARVVEELAALHGPAALLVLDDSPGWADNQQRTVVAIRAGIPIIVGGRLPDSNGRTGAPDVLIRHDDGYLPIDIKAHQSMKAGKRSTVQVSRLCAPGQRRLLEGYSNRANRWHDDVMQLAHYTRMLQELGFHPTAGPRIGGIIGSSDLTDLLGEGRGITWYDLDAETMATYSASGPGNRRKRSALQRYDHEFDFRIAVARAARAGGELVRPYRISECDTCAWFDYCAQVAGADDASFATETGHLKIREWQYLYANCGDNGALTVSRLADVDCDAHIDGFRTQSVGTQQPAIRLANAVKRAQLTRAGRHFEPRGEPRVPAADIEVDFDIEWDTAGRIYQWGLRIRAGQDDSTARYEPVVSFAPLDDDGETALAEEFAARVRELRALAEREGKSLSVFHWSHPEISYTRRFDSVVAALDGLTVDLRGWFEANYFARTSTSIKSIAAALGFQWDVVDPGGFASQAKIDLARGSGPEADAARAWCLTYNRSDVAAQAAIRDGLQAQSCG